MIQSPQGRRPPPPLVQAQPPHLGRALMGHDPKHNKEDHAMTQQDLQELCVVDAYTTRIWTFTTAENAGADIAQAKADAAEHLPFWENLAARSGDPHDKKVAESYRCADYRIMTFVS